MTDFGSYKGIKREANFDGMGDNEGPSKRPRSGGRSVDVRFLVQSKNAGAIIGKGGANINRLRTEFSASVTVPDCPGPERILAIVADSETLGEILLDTIPKLDDYSHHRNMEFDCELRMLLHQSHAGCLIGKGGTRIKELREKTGSQIKIFSNCCPNSTERVVQITGTPSVVVDCVKEICNVVSTSPIKGPNKQYDPHHFNPMFSNDYGGYEDTGPKGRGGGRGGFRGGFDGGRGGRGNFGGRGRGSFGGGGRGGWKGGQGGGGSGNYGGWVTENDTGFSGGNRMMNNSMNGQNNSGYMPQGASNFGADKPMGPAMHGMRNPSAGFPMGDMGMNPRFMGGQMQRPMMKPQFGAGPPLPNTGELFVSKPTPIANGTCSIVMKIPNDVAGAIIGKGGQRIRKIRRDSAAQINIEEAAQGSNERVITITGVPSQATLAQQLMQQSVRENQGGGGRRF